jgi:hypothetical protein
MCLLNQATLSPKGFDDIQCRNQITDIDAEEDTQPATSRLI